MLFRARLGRHGNAEAADIIEHLVERFIAGIRGGCSRLRLHSRNLGPDLDSILYLWRRPSSSHSTLDISERFARRVVFAEFSSDETIQNDTPIAGGVTQHLRAN